MKTRESKILVLIVMFAFFVRIVFFLFYSGDAAYPGFFEAPWPGSDAIVYEQVGHAMAEYDFSRINDDPLKAQLHSLYLFFLASIYKLFGHQYFMVRLFQAILSSLTVALIFFIAKKTFNERVAYISSAFAALSPMSISVSGRFMSETMFTFLLSLLICFLLYMNKKQAFRDALVAGIFISLSLLTNSMILGFVPFLIIWFFFTYKEKKISPKYIVLILSVVCLALVLKTFMLKDPIGDRGAAYRGFWLWNNPYKKSDEKYVLPSHPGFHEYKQSLNKTDAELKVLFLNYVKDYPLEYIKGAWYRFLLFWHFDSQSVRSGARWKYQVVGFLSYGMFVPFFLLGLCLSFKDWKKSLIFYLLFFYFTLVAVLLSSGIRKRIPIEPFIFMYVAYSMSWLWDKIYKTKNHLRK